MNMYNNNDDVEQHQQHHEKQANKNQYSYKKIIAYVLISVLICSVSILYISSSSSSISYINTTSRQLLSKENSHSKIEEKRSLSKKSSKKSEKSEDKAPSPSKEYTLPTLPTVYIPTIWSPSPYPTHKPTGIQNFLLIILNLI